MIYSTDSSNITIETSEFNDNVAYDVLYLFSSNVKIELSTFFNNAAFFSIFWFVRSKLKQVLFSTILHFGVYFGSWAMKLQ